MLVRQIYLLLGLLAMVCAVAGALLPLLPTTVFVIIAAACFGRASPRLQAWLYAHPRFGPLLRDWHEQGAVGRRAKRAAGSGMGLGLLLFFWQARPGPMLAAMVSLVMLGCALYVLSRPLPRAEGLEHPVPSAALSLPGKRAWGLGLSVALHVLPLAWLCFWPRSLPLTVTQQTQLIPVQLPLLRAAAAPQPVELRVAPQPSVDRPGNKKTEQLAAAESDPSPLPKPQLSPPPDQELAPTSRVAPHRPAAPEAMSQAAAPPSPALPPAPQPSRAAVQDSWQARALARLEQFRRYPSGARARREQGVSHVWLRINRAGQVLALRLERSSGHAELDRAALATVQRATPLPMLPPELPDELELLLPVEFFFS